MVNINVFSYLLPLQKISECLSYLQDRSVLIGDSFVPDNLSSIQSSKRREPVPDSSPGLFLYLLAQWEWRVVA
jgi:hypothetical protein